MLDGQPLAQGTITFSPTGAGTPAGGEIKDGKFNIPAHLGPVVGPNKVEIRSIQKTGRLVKPTMMPEGDFDPAKIEAVEEFLDVVPKQYNSETQLLYELRAGENVISLDLSSKLEKQEAR
jgi:hypothetical protein